MCLICLLSQRRSTHHFYLNWVNQERSSYPWYRAQGCAKPSLLLPQPENVYELCGVCRLWELLVRKGLSHSRKAAVMLCQPVIPEDLGPSALKVGPHAVLCVCLVGFAPWSVLLSTPGAPHCSVPWGHASNRVSMITSSSCLYWGALLALCLLYITWKDRLQFPLTKLSRRHHSFLRTQADKWNNACCSNGDLSKLCILGDWECLGSSRVASKDLQQ